jgi:hypothetical protein
VCAQVLSLLDEMVRTAEQAGDAGRFRAALAYQLRLARAVAERDATLAGVTQSLARLAECVTAAASLADPAVQRVVEAVVLDVMLCLSEH